MESITITAINMICYTVLYMHSVATIVSGYANDDASHIIMICHIKMVIFFLCHLAMNIL